MGVGAQKLQEGAECAQGCADKELSPIKDVGRGILERSVMTGR